VPEVEEGEKKKKEKMKGKKKRVQLPPTCPPHVELDEKKTNQAYLSNYRKLFVYPTSGGQQPTIHNNSLY
jgi:hypothetical protein